MKQRVMGFDLARALAVFGIVIVNFRLAMGAENRNPLLISFAESFGGRVSAWFVILASVGVTFLTNFSSESEARGLLSLN
ncbi:MAG: hypothetical protein ACI9LY_000060 [Arenicella sp.]|jgi:uncharacterized protein